MNGKLKIKFIDFKVQNQGIIKDLHKAILDEVDNNDYILGKAVSNFENNFAKYCGLKYCIGVNSGTDALFLALKVIDIKHGDEVITCANTFVSTIFSIIYCGAKPILVDCNEYGLIDVDQIEKKINKKTKAIIPVHLFGQMADMDSIARISRKYDLKIIEDAAQAHGSCQNKMKVGYFSDMACFSFYPSKNLGAFGDTGAILSNNLSHFNQLKLLNNYGFSKKYYSDIVGYNSRLDSIQAQVLNLKLKYLDKWNNERIKLAKAYNLELAQINKIETPKVFCGNKHVYHIYGIKVEKRDKLQEFLLKNGIQTLVHYPIPTHLQMSCKFLGYKKGDFVKTEEFSDKELSLPLYPGMKVFEVIYVCKIIKQYYDKK